MNLLDNAGGVKAIGSFSLDNSFAVRGMRVMEDKKGRNFVAFPSRERANGDYEDIAFPLSKEFYHQITDAFMKEFHRKQEEMSLSVRRMYMNLFGAMRQKQEMCKMRLHILWICKRKLLWKKRQSGKISKNISQ